FKGANDRAFEGPILRLQSRDVRFDLFCDVGGGGRAVARGKFQPLILRRVVARRHVDAAQRFSATNGVSDDRRGGVALAEQGSQAVGGGNFGGSEGKFAA